MSASPLLRAIQTLFHLHLRLSLTSPPTCSRSSPLRSTGCTGKKGETAAAVAIEALEDLEDDAIRGESGDAVSSDVVYYYRVGNLNNLRCVKYPGNILVKISRAPCSM